MLGCQASKLLALSTAALALAPFHGLRAQESNKPFTTEQLEGALRGIVATLSVVELMRERKKFSDQIAADVSQELAEQGLILDSFQIKGITDKVGYIQSLGAPEIQAKRQAAEISQTNADRAINQKNIANQEANLVEQTALDTTRQVASGLTGAAVKTATGLAGQAARSAAGTVGRGVGAAAGMGKAAARAMQAAPAQAPAPRSQPAARKRAASRRATAACAWARRSAARAGSSVTAKPSPKPTPAFSSSLNSPTLCCVRSPPPGRWLATISSNVLGLMNCTPSKAPPFSRILQKR